jgi:hypothetical protein
LAAGFLRYDTESSVLPEAANEEFLVLFGEAR